MIKFTFNVYQRLSNEQRIELTNFTKAGFEFYKNSSML